MRANTSCVVVLRLAARAIADNDWARVHDPLSGVSVFYRRTGVIGMRCMSIHDCTVPTSPHPVARRAANGEEAQGEEGEEDEGPEEEIVRPYALRLHVERDV